MSVKIKKIIVCSMLMLYFSMVEAMINCEGKRFYCETDNTYFLCFDDRRLNTTVTVTDRSTLCPTGTFCDNNSDVFCDTDTSMDCEGRIFLCTTINTFLMCFDQPDGTKRTQSTTLQDCLSGYHCDITLTDVQCAAPSTDGTTLTTEEVTETTSSDSPPIITEPTTTPETTTLESTTPETTTTETTTPQTTTPRTVPTPPTPPPKLGELPGYKCTDIGYFAHPTDCRRYIYCYFSFETSHYEHNQYQCTKELIYDPATRKCTTNTKPCDDLKFKCVVRGTFANPINNHKYIVCVPRVPSTFYELHYTCPGGKIFDANAKACVAPVQNLEIETLGRRVLSVIQDDDEEDKEFFEESDEMVVDKIYLNSNEDASINLHSGESSKFSLL